MTSHLFIFGMGYVAQALARALKAEGWTISGTTRNADKADHLRGLGYHINDMTRVAEASHILLSTPPGDGDAIARNALAAANAPKWLGYLSATSVYGAGGPYDEKAKTEPNTARGQQRLQAEQDWQAFCDAHHLPLHIFRMAGIYGPGRNALENIKKGTARRIVKWHHRFSRIHVEDIVAILKASMQNPLEGSIYNLADDKPAANSAVVAYAAKLLKVDAPPKENFATAEMSDALRSFYADNRTVKNKKIKKELGITLKYPTYKKGLSALAEEMAKTGE